MLTRIHVTANVHRVEQAEVTVRHYPAKTDHHEFVSVSLDDEVALMFDTLPGLIAWCEATADKAREAT